MVADFFFNLISDNSGRIGKPSIFFKMFSFSRPAGEVFVLRHQPPTTCNTTSLTKSQIVKLDSFVEDVRRDLEATLCPSLLKSISLKLREQCREKMHDSHICMLPSFNHTLPTGQELGTYLALDMGGSTFRIALVELRGKQRGSDCMRITRSKEFKIDKAVRELPGLTFFDWMAAKIEETLAGTKEAALDALSPLCMGLAWSFPVEQLSISRANILQMGKGFLGTTSLQGHGLGELIMEACAKRNLNVSIGAILNDSSATLLSRAYVDESTRMALILGTGLNAAVLLPTSSLGKPKYGRRPQAWHQNAQRVVVNSEVSMFGKGAIPLTRWDERLKRNHSQPDFQPLEQLTAGGYLGEMVRIILLEAIVTSHLFSGLTPANFEPYELTTETIAAIEHDSTPDLCKAAATLNAKHPLPQGLTYSEKDVAVVQEIIELVSSRAAAYMATSVHALWALRLQTEGTDLETSAPICVGYNGSVLEKYPTFEKRVQYWIDQLTGQPSQVRLELAPESTLLGAAIGACCQQEDEDLAMP